MKITAEDLVKFGVCEHIIEEPDGGAHRDPALTIENIGEYLTETLPRLMSVSTEEMLNKRYEKFRKIGVFAEN